MAVKPIVAGTDGSGQSLRAVEWAAREASRRGAPLRIVSVLDSLTMPAYVAAGKVLADAAGRAGLVAPGLRIGTSLLPGEPGPVLACLGSFVSMIVVGSCGVGRPGAAGTTGPVSRYLTGVAPCPVVVISGGDAAAA